MSLENANFPPDHLGYGADARKGLTSLYGKACQSREAAAVLVALLEFVTDKVKSDLEKELKGYEARYTPDKRTPAEKAAASAKIEAAIAAEIKAGADKLAAEKAAKDKPKEPAVETSGSPAKDSAKAVDKVETPVMQKITPAPVAK